MLESLLLSKRKVSKVLVDIDFTAAQVGDRAIVDRGSLGATYIRSTMGATLGDSVVDVPGKGRAYYFDGSAKFTADKIPVVYNKAHRITVAIMTSTAKSGTIVASGAYPDYAGLRSGYALHSGQYPSSYIQHFIVDAYGNYQRVLLDGAVPAGVIDNIVLTRAANAAYTVESTTRGVKNVYPPIGFIPTDSYFIIGGTHSNDNFQGHLFSLKIELLE